MPDLDFPGLRADVETATKIPGFDTVRRRARRIRLRDRLAVVVALFTVGGLATPVALTALAGSAGPGPSVLVGPDRPIGPTGDDQSPDGTAPVTVTGYQATVRAVGGVDFEHLYAAVDVCAAVPAGTSCDLQVSLVAPSTDRQHAPVVMGQLRSAPAVTLGDVQLNPLTARSLMLSAVPSGGLRQYSRIAVPQSAGDFAGGASEPSPPSGSVGVLSPGDRAVQLTENGELYGVRAVDDRLTKLASQPPLEQPVLATGVEPSAGWWVTGLDVLTSDLAVSVSRDEGRSWTTRRLGTPPPADQPAAVTSSDGRTGYVFLRTTQNAVITLRTADGGGSWREMAPALVHLPAHLAVPGTHVGAVMRADGSVLMWVDDGTVPAYLETTDGGVSFHSVTGPGGRVVAVGGGFAVISTPPQISRDARTWTTVPVPAFLPPG